ncbi:hypothetical protein BJX76DRAFT_356720 [Aspergillus varians]
MYRIAVALMVALSAVMGSAHTIECGDPFIPAFTGTVDDMIWVLRRTIKPAPNISDRSKTTLAPNTCEEVLCWDHTAIAWCNDDSENERKMAYNEIANGAQAIRNKCTDGSIVSGVVDHPDKWRAFVRFDDEC